SARPGCGAEDRTARRRPQTPGPAGRSGVAGGCAGRYRSFLPQCRAPRSAVAVRVFLESGPVRPRVPGSPEGVPPAPAVLSGPERGGPAARPRFAVAPPLRAALPGRVGLARPAVAGGARVGTVRADAHALTHA